MALGIVNVSHPAPLLCRHRTPGQARVDFVRAVTPLRLREASEGEFELVARHGACIGVPPTEVFAHEGGLWTRSQLTPDGLVAALEDANGDGRQAETLSQNRLRLLFARSPLVANWAEGPARGLPAEARRVRTVLADGTERAGRDVARFLDERVRVVGAAVYRRCDGPVAEHFWTNLHPGFRVRMGGLRHVIGNMVKSEHVVAPRPDRAAAFWDFERAFHLGLDDGKVRGKALEAPVTVDMAGLGDVPPEMFGDPDVMALAWDGPYVVLRNLPPALHADPAVAGAARRLHGWCALGLVGSTRLDEAPDVAQAIADLVEAAARAAAPGGVPVPALKLGAYAREVALPLLRAGPAPVPEDEDAMEGLAP